MMKRFTLFVAVLFIALCLAGCADKTDENPSPIVNDNPSVSQETAVQDPAKEEAKASGLIEVPDTHTEVTLYEDENCSIICWGPSTSSTSYKLCFKFTNKTADKTLVFFADKLSVQGANATLSRSYKLGDGVSAWGAMFCDAGSSMIGEFAQDKDDVPGLEISKYDTIAFTMHVVDQAAYPEELVTFPVTLHFGSN